VVLCVLYCIRVCIMTSLKVVNVDFLEGNIFLRMAISSVHGCVAVCDQHGPSCHGSRYNAASKECQLLDKWSSARTTTFYANEGWKIFMTVRQHDMMAI